MTRDEALKILERNDKAHPRTLAKSEGVLEGYEQGVRDAEKAVGKALGFTFPAQRAKEIILALLDGKEKKA